jgi:peptidoglycan/xylan/chitin deacetylase (PgdA/CDA1 family)
LLVSLLVPATGALGIEPARAVTGPTFGSQAVLDACWTPEELKATPQEKTAVRLHPSPLPSRPHRTEPIAWADAPAAHVRGVVRSVEPPPGRRPVALTFDLCEREGERTGYDGAIVDYLRAHRLRATFFAGGKWLLSHPDRAKQLMADPLFEIGNHTWSHRNLRVLGGRERDEEIAWPQAEYEFLREELERSAGGLRAGAEELAKIPRVPVLLRFPFGSCDAAALEAVARRGLTAMQWDVVPGDPWVGQTAEGIAREILSRVKPGSIVVCHANGRGRGTSEALALFVPKLLEQGYEFVTASELLGLGTAVTLPECYIRRPGDTARYDRTPRRHP